MLEFDSTSFQQNLELTSFSLESSNSLRYDLIELNCGKYLLIFAIGCCSQPILMKNLSFLKTHYMEHLQEPTVVHYLQLYLAADL